MSVNKTYEKEMTPTRVKSKERGDVDINRLVQHGPGRIQPAQPIYADLTDLPVSRGEAAHRLLEIEKSSAHVELLKALLTLPPDQANNFLSTLRPPAPNANDKTNATTAGSDQNSQSKPPESAK